MGIFTRFWHWVSRLFTRIGPGSQHSAHAPEQTDSDRRVVQPERRRRKPRQPVPLSPRVIDSQMRPGTTPAAVEPFLVFSATSGTSIISAVCCVSDTVLTGLRVRTTEYRGDWPAVSLGIGPHPACQIVWGDEAIVHPPSSPDCIWMDAARAALTICTFPNHGLPVPSVQEKFQIVVVSSDAVAVHTFRIEPGERWPGKAIKTLHRVFSTGGGVADDRVLTSMMQLLADLPVIIVAAPEFYEAGNRSALADRLIEAVKNKPDTAVLTSAQLCKAVSKSWGDAWWRGAAEWPPVRSRMPKIRMLRCLAGDLAVHELRPSFRSVSGTVNLDLTGTGDRVILESVQQDSAGVVRQVLDVRFPARTGTISRATIDICPRTDSTRLCLCHDSMRDNLAFWPVEGQSPALQRARPTQNRIRIAILLDSATGTKNPGFVQRVAFLLLELADRTLSVSVIRPAEEGALTARLWNEQEWLDQIEFCRSKDARALLRSDETGARGLRAMRQLVLTILGSGPQESVRPTTSTGHDPAELVSAMFLNVPDHQQVRNSKRDNAVLILAEGGSPGNQNLIPLASDWNDTAGRLAWCTNMSRVPGRPLTILGCVGQDPESTSPIVSCLRDLVMVGRQNRIQGPLLLNWSSVDQQQDSESVRNDAQAVIEVIDQAESEIQPFEQIRISMSLNPDQQQIRSLRNDHRQSCLHLTSAWISASTQQIN